MFAQARPALPAPRALLPAAAALQVQSSGGRGLGWAGGRGGAVGEGSWSSQQGGPPEEGGEDSGP